MKYAKQSFYIDAFFCGFPFLIHICTKPKSIRLAFKKTHKHTLVLSICHTAKHFMSRHSLLYKNRLMTTITWRARIFML